MKNFRLLALIGLCCGICFSARGMENKPTINFTKCAQMRKIKVHLNIIVKELHNLELLSSQEGVLSSQQEANIIAQGLDKVHRALGLNLVLHDMWPKTNHNRVAIALAQIDSQEWNDSRNVKPIKKRD